MDRGLKPSSASFNVSGWVMRKMVSSYIALSSLQWAPTGGAHTSACESGINFGDFDRLTISKAERDSVFNILDQCFVTSTFRS